MTRGRHRQSSSARTTIPLVAVGALAVSGAALALVVSDPRLLRLGVSCSLAATVSVAVLLRVRERDSARDLAVEVSARRRDEAVFAEQVQGLRGTVDKLTVELVELRAELAEVTAAHSAAMLVSTAPWRPGPLGREAFLAAAGAFGSAPERALAALAADGDGTGSEDVLADGTGSAQPQPADACAETAATAEPAAADAEPVLAEVEPVLAEVEPVVAEVEPVLAEVDPVVAEVEPVVAEVEPVLAEVDPVVAEVEPVLAEVPAPEPVPVASGMETERARQEELERELAAVAGDGDERVIVDLTAHDDTQPLKLAGVRRHA